MSKRRARRISVLLIPDDNVEPYSFQINLRTVRLLVFVGIILTIHMIVGGVAYWRWYRVHSENLQLLEDNQRLLEDNKRIYLLASRFEDLVYQHRKVLRALGVEGLNASPSSLKELSVDGVKSIPALRRDLERKGLSQSNARLISGKSSFIARRKTRVHNYMPYLPTYLPVEGYLTADFEPYSWLSGRRHPGIDIAARRGKVIYAAGGGMVVFAGWTSRYGNMVIISHGDNIFSYYAHNSKLLVQDKVFVKKGDPIALLGDTGSSSTGPHLHFEIWKDGVPVNPRDFILAFQSELEE
ncbi:MAG: M23 family metallopeptidase [candidate division KSB1 bacterium]|nr:M23 family metallopeptidase [candidate division KSB1 bacterium]